MDDGETTRELLQAAVDDHGFLSWLDLRVDEVDVGRLVLRVPHDEKLINHANQRGEVHGGIAATLVDTAGGVVCRTEMDDPRGVGAATIDLNISYLRAAVGDLVATAETVRVGTTVGVASVTVESETPNEGVAPVATGRGSFRLFRDAD